MKKRVGLLGGTFDPPHKGHLKISTQALKKLNLFEVWWIVALQNPLKLNQNIKNFSIRFKNSKIYTKKYQRIKISCIEEQYNINFSIDSINKLKKKFRHTDFIWIMGADNFANLHYWKQWNKFMEEVPIAVFNRPGYSQKALLSKAASCYKKYRCKNYYKLINNFSSPKWAYIWDTNEKISSSYIRNICKEKN